MSLGGDTGQKKKISLCPEIHCARLVVIHLSMFRFSRPSGGAVRLMATCSSTIHQATIAGSHSILVTSQPAASTKHGRRRYHNARKTVCEDPSSSQSRARGDSATMERINHMAQSLEQVSIAKDSQLPTISRLEAVSASPYPSPSPAGESDGLAVYLPTASSLHEQNFSIRRKIHGGRDAKVPPSKESGGVPNVSPEYSERSNVIPQALSIPQNLLVVIDLNGTLLYRPSRTAPTKFLMRPHASLFLQYCVDTFTVVIWSSARPENVRAMCDAILSPELRGKVAAVWGRDKFNLTSADFNLRVQCYKRLSRIWGDAKIQASHPGYSFGGRWDQTNTVLIDDSREKGRSEPHNLIVVPEWMGDLTEADNILPQVHDHLNHLSMHSNVSASLRSYPFRPRVGIVSRPS
jgi:hypothetical protein